MLVLSFDRNDLFWRDTELFTGLQGMELGDALELNYTELVRKNIIICACF